jgi:NAD(P)-dependent dehydrogenase (short-subunit alcohol dehydrogenase family)
MSSPKRLSGEFAIVTGAARGLGEAIAKNFSIVMIS